MCAVGSCSVLSILKEPFHRLAPQLAVGKLISGFILGATRVIRKYAVRAPSQVTCGLGGPCKLGTVTALSGCYRCPSEIRTGNKIYGLAGKGMATCKTVTFENGKSFWMSRKDRGQDGECG